MNNTRAQEAKLMHGLNPQQSTCPNCGIERTVRVGASGISICMNCRARWRSAAASITPTTDAVDESEPAYGFTQAEMERLKIYRRAVAAGFYAD
jgi:ribosomal protein L37AE/L43A